MTTLQALADRVAQGGALTLDDADVVAGSHDLIAIGVMADEVRRKHHGARTTFVRVLEVHADVVPSALPPQASVGEFRIIKAPASLAEAVTAVRGVRALAGSAYLSAFSLREIESMSDSLQSACKELAAAGLTALAEVAVDDEADPVGAIAAARAAGLRVERLAVTNAPSDVVALLRRALDIATRAGGIRVFSPLPRSISIANPTTGYDDVKSVALARLLLTDVPSIQVDWAAYGPKLAQVALTVGADDVDGVAAVEPGTLGPRRTVVEEIKGNIRAAGLEPVERDGYFGVL